MLMVAVWPAVFAAAPIFDPKGNNLACCLITPPQLCYCMNLCDTGWSLWTLSPGFKLTTLVVPLGVNRVLKARDTVAHPRTSCTLIYK